MRIQTQTRPVGDALGNLSSDCGNADLLDALVLPVDDVEPSELATNIHVDGPIVRQKPADKAKPEI